MYQITQVISTSILVMCYMWVIGFLLFLGGDKELERVFLFITNGSTTDNSMTLPMEFPDFSDDCEELSLNTSG